MVDFKKDSWLYALIAAILALIAIFTPWGSVEVMTVTIQGWMGGAVTYLGDPVDTWGPAGGLALWTFGLTIFSITSLLFVGVGTWRGNEFKWDWLIYLVTGLLMLICTILTLVLESTSGGVIGFAPIGLIIAGVIAIGAFAVDKFLGE